MMVEAIARLEEKILRGWQRLAHFVIQFPDCDLTVSLYATK